MTTQKLSPAMKAAVRSALWGMMRCGHSPARNVNRNLIHLFTPTHLALERRGIMERVAFHVSDDIELPALRLSFDVCASFDFSEFQGA